MAEDGYGIFVFLNTWLHNSRPNQRHGLWNWEVRKHILPCGVHFVLASLWDHVQLLWETYRSQCQMLCLRSCYLIMLNLQIKNLHKNTAQKVLVFCFINLKICKRNIVIIHDVKHLSWSYQPHCRHCKDQNASTKLQ